MAKFIKTQEFLVHNRYAQMFRQRHACIPFLLLSQDFMVLDRYIQQGFGQRHPCIPSLFQPVVFLPSRPSVTPSLSTGSIDQRPIDPLVKPSPIPSLHSSGASFVVQPEASLSSQQSTFASASVPTFFSSVPSINSSEMPQIIKEDQSESNRPKKLKTCRRHEVTCPTCSIVLASRGHLMQHMKSHNSVKPSVSFEFNAEHKMTCPTCGLVVATKGHLKQHIRSHSTSTSNRCYKCNCTFTQRSKLSSHLLRAHGISFKRVRAIPQG
nr:sal-like protein 4 isoform X1 [Cherax quadricarinatus]XP_053639616.1 sal-like protein 4 isoform X1 [Cherax quadricarinatus]